MAVRSPEQVLIDELEECPAVAEVIGGRFFPVIAPASAALPFPTWRRAGVQREMTLQGPSGVTTVTLAVDIYAETYAAVREIADRCRSVLDGFNGTLGNWVSVRNVSLLNEQDGFVSLAGGDLPPVYSVTQTYNVLWQET